MLYFLSLYLLKQVYVSLGLSNSSPGCAALHSECYGQQRPGQACSL